MVQVEIINDKIHLLTKKTLYTKSVTYKIENLIVKAYYPNTMLPLRVEELLYLNVFTLKQFSKLH